MTLRPLQRACCA